MRAQRSRLGCGVPACPGDDGPLRRRTRRVAATMSLAFQGDVITCPLSDAARRKRVNLRVRFVDFCAYRLLS